MIYTVKVSNIIYDITPADLELYEEDFDSTSAYEEACKKQIEEIEKSLPSEMTFDIDIDYYTNNGENEDRVFEALGDEIVKRTGWLVFTFDYEGV